MSEIGDVLESAAVLNSVLQEICVERMAQITREGFSLTHDDGHEDGAIAGAAASYAFAAAAQASGISPDTLLKGHPPMWPHGWEWKPKAQRRNLICAAALILAEIQRLDRLSPHA